MKTFTCLIIFFLISYVATSQTNLGYVSTTPVVLEINNEITEISCNYQLFYDSEMFQPSCSRNYAGKNVYFSFILPENGKIRISLNNKSVMDHGIALYNVLGDNWNEIACSQVISNISFIEMSDSTLAGQLITGRIWINSGSDIGLFTLKFETNTETAASKALVIGILSATPEDLVNNVLISGCVQASNIQFTGHPESIGYFTNGTPGLDFSSGIILSTGKATKAAGPNNSPATCTNLSQPGDAMLTALINRSTYDAAILEFDFIPSNNTISFQYAFGSEEYEEYVGGVFNDIFAFIISGGPENYINRNIALVPGTNTPVSINNVNQIHNTEWYYNNDNGQNIQFDGMTRTLTAVAAVTPCETYHIRLAIADAADPIFDSGVFLKAGSFNSGTIPLVKNITDWIMVNTTYEGCNNNLMFARSDNNNISEPLNFNIEISGTAESQTDYSPIPLSLQIPAGEESIAVPYSVFMDNIVEGLETINVKIFTGCQCGIEYIEETININDNIEISGSISNNSPKCAGDSVLISLDIDVLPEHYEILWSTGQIGQTSIYAILGESQNVTAEVRYPCGSELFSTWVDILELPQANISTNAPICDGQDLEFSAEDGISYLWKGPYGWSNTSSNPTITNVGVVRSGFYGVTVTGANGCEYVEMLDVQIHSWPAPQLPQNRILCERDNLLLNPGDFYEYSWSGPLNWTSNQNILAINNITLQNTGTYFLTVSDNIGCTGSAFVEVLVNPSPVANVSFNYPICRGENLSLLGSAEGQVWWTGPNGLYLENTNVEIENVDEQNTGYYGFYAINQFNCKDSVINFINITIPDASILINGPFCSNQNNIILQSLYPDGIWSGLGITNPQIGNFSPSLAGIGDQQITYHIGYNGCEDTQTTSITVEEAPIFSLTIPAELCDNEGIVFLNSDITGGTWSGNGMINVNTGAFDPIVAGTGNSFISYSISQGACTITHTDSILVVHGVDASIFPVENVCEYHTSFWLSAASSGGMWHGPGIVNMFTGQFNPVIAGNGIHRIYYSVNNAHCQDIDSVDITVDSYASANVGSDLQFCINDPEIMLTAQNPGGQWTGLGVSSTGIFSPSISGVGSNQLIYTITSGECSSTDTINIIVGNYLSAEFTAPAQICEFEFPITLIAQNAGGIWSGNGITDSITGKFSPTIAGDGFTEITYSISYNGCTSNFTEQIEVLSAPNPGMLGSGIFCINDSEVNLQSITSGGNWSGTGITDNILGIFNPAIAGTGPSLISYTISNLECTSVGYRYLYVYDGNEIITFNTPEQVCENSQEFILHAEPQGGVWSGSGVLLDSIFNPAILTPGTYTLFYTIGTGLCENTNSIDIQVLPLAQLSLLTQNEYCSNAVSVLLNTESDSGFWSGNAVNNNYFNPQLAQIGSNSVLFNYNDGICQNSYEFNILVKPQTPVVISGLEESYCQNYGSVNVDVIPSGGVFTGLNLSAENSFTTNNLNIGNNNLTYNFTNSDGCFSERTVNFEILEVPEVIVSGIATEYCVNSNDISFHAIPFGGLASGVEIFGNTVISLSTTGNGEHYFTYSYTAPNGCSDIYTQSVLIHGLPEISFEILNYPSCVYSEDASVKVIFPDSANYEIIWDNGNAVNIDVLSDVGSGWHFVEITNEFGCTVFDSVFISAPQELSVSINGTNSLPCYNTQNGVLNAFVSGGAEPYTYLWSVDENATFPNITGLGPGSYYLTVTDGNLCEVLASKSITQATEILYQVESTESLNCFGDENAFINVNTQNPSLSILWENESTEFSRNNLGAGTYGFTITDEYNCQILDTIEIFENPEINVQETINNVNCGISLGSIYTNTIGGISPYYYQWSQGNETSVLSNVPAGQYQLTVKDAKSCIKNYDYLIIANDSINANISVLSEIDCYGNNNGAIKAFSVDGHLPLSYLWSDGSHNVELGDVVSGEYSVIICDAQGCLGYSTVVLTDPAELITDYEIENVMCKGESTGRITLHSQGGTGVITYQWQDGSWGQEANNLSAGNYSFTTTDSNQCKTIQNISISEPQTKLDYSLVSLNVKCWGESGGYFNPQAIGGTPPYQYIWEKDGYTTVSQNITNLYAGNYNIEITDANNCKFTDKAEIAQPAKVEFTATSYAVSCDGKNDGWFTINANGGTQPYLYVDSDIKTVENEFKDKFPGQYSVYVIDDNNCISETQQVNVASSDADCLTIPNAFTPNNDGINDKWEIINIEMFPRARVQVFNRWGQLVFETISDNEIWDGTFWGKMPAGTYLYIIDLNNGSKSKTGTINLVR